MLVVLLGLLLSNWVITAIRDPTSREELRTKFLHSCFPQLPSGRSKDSFIPQRKNLEKQQMLTFTLNTNKTDNQ